MAQQRGGTGRRIAAVAGLIAVAIVLYLVWHHSVPARIEGRKQLTIEIVHGDGSRRTVSLDTQQEVLGRALVEAGLVVDDQADFGLYIQTADGETANSDNQEWWCVTKKGEPVGTGADSTPIADGDCYELTLTVGY